MFYLFIGPGHLSNRGNQYGSMQMRPPGSEAKCVIWLWSSSRSQQEHIFHQEVVSINKSVSSVILHPHPALTVCAFYTNATTHSRH